MRRFFGILIFVVGSSFSAEAQLANGSVAPDFTLTDIHGTTHNLYSYLDQGKVVYLEFFACHCPSCWAYHNSGKLEDLYQTYGPDGTDQIQVLMLEHDENNTDDHFYGNHWYTQGDWVTGHTIPKFNVEGADRQVFTDYDMNWYPLIYKICTDRTVEVISTSASVADMYQKADDCPGTLGVEDKTEQIEFTIENNQLILTGLEGIEQVNAINSLGQTIELAGENNRYDLSVSNSGIYFFTVQHADGIGTLKLFIE